ATATTGTRATPPRNISRLSRSTGTLRCTAARSGLPLCLIRSLRSRALPPPSISVPIDREATLKQADKLLKQGKLDAAIAEYVRLIDDQPQDWTTINALGDLYLRGRNNEKAIEQYIRVADHQFAEGFFQKSAALYKKALKLDPENEHILMQLAEIGERQGKFVDAKQFLRQGASARQVGRGGRRGCRL